MTKRKLIIVVGISGSGKSTKAKEWLTEKSSYEHPRSRVNRDDLRKMLFGYDDNTLYKYYKHPQIKQREKLLTAVQTSVIADSLGDIIIDNTHLKISYITDLVDTWDKANNICFWIMKTPLAECIKRDGLRDAKVGEIIIRKQYKSFVKLLINPTFVHYISNYKTLNI